MCVRGIEWLSNKIPEFGALSKEDKEAIQDFSLLWSYFEGTKLKGKANINAIIEYVKSIEYDVSYKRLNIAGYLQYLRDRYFVSGAFTKFYTGLHLEKTNHAEEKVNRILQGGNNISREDELIGCLVIIYRLRNNLFHGDKWHYNLQEQYDNFRKANDFLMALMDK
jgi:hypothetical protein